MRLSKTRDQEAAEALFKQAKETVGYKPEKVTTDGHDSYPKAIHNFEAASRFTSAFEEVNDYFRYQTYKNEKYLSRGSGPSSSCDLHILKGNF